jgi:hypothetical protein
MALSAPFRRGRRSCATMSAAFGADSDDLETVLRGQVCPGSSSYRSFILFQSIPSVLLMAE